MGTAGGTGYDAVIVGARCAGTPLAVRLAGAGRRVLLLDDKPPPADTISSHFLFPNTLARLEQLGVLERIRARHRINLLEHRLYALGNELRGRFTPVGGFDRMCSITRPVLDGALLEAAVDAGAETRFGARVAGLVGAGTAEDPVRGVELVDGERVLAERVIGADGRASAVARLLGLEKREPLAGEIGFLFAYWRGVPPSPAFHLHINEIKTLTWSNCQDDVSILAVSGPGDFTHGNAEQRLARLVASLGEFPESFDVGWLEQAELVSDVRVAPEPMMRGFFREAAGPGWALVGDAGHFKHPGTAQGISDAIEQSLHVADALTRDDPELEGYGRWRDERAAEHYEWSFAFGRLPKPEVAVPMFAGLAGDPEAAQDFRDAFARTVLPRSGVLTRERMGRWLAAAADRAPSG